MIITGCTVMVGGERVQHSLLAHIVEGSPERVIGGSNDAPSRTALEANMPAMELENACSES